MKRKSELIVALDVPTFEEARGLVDALEDTVQIYKVGSQLFTACGPIVVRHLLARGKRVFLDLKFHDIPNTVAHAVKSATCLSRLPHDMIKEEAAGNDVLSGVHMLTVHTLGGEAMLKRAAEASRQTADEIGVKRPLIIGITVLTSEIKTDNIQQIVLERAQLALQCGLDGVVASSQEAGMIRRELGDKIVIVTPGIRPQGATTDDQERVTTPAEAVSNGSNFLVVGRPIVQAKDPLKAAQQICNEIKQANSTN